MKWKRIAAVIGAVLVLAAIVIFTVQRARASYTKVLIGNVARGSVVSMVSGTGQIKPKTYVNIGATAFGRITHLYVKEGEHVHRGEVLATVESVQPEASVAAQKQSISSAQTDISSYIAAEQTAQANIEHAQADLEQKQLDFKRYQQPTTKSWCRSRISTPAKPPTTWMSPRSPRRRLRWPRRRRRQPRRAGTSARLSRRCARTWTRSTRQSASLPTTAS